MLPVKKVYIDTRYKTNDSISTSQFKIELPDTLALPHNTIFHLDDISIPHSWRTVEEDVNDTLYMQVSVLDASLPDNTNTCKLVTLAPGHYQTIQLLANEIESKANIQFNTAANPNPFTVTVNDSTKTLKFVCLNTIKAKVFTNSDIKSKLVNYAQNNWDGSYIGNVPNVWDGSWKGDYYDSDNSHNANELIGNTEGPGVLFNLGTPFTTGYVDLQPIKNVYIHSANLGSFKTIGPKGESTIIKKVPVTANENQMIFSTVTSSSDYLDCSRQTLKTISFELKDAHGRIINLHGANLSFSIVFDKYRSDVAN